MENTPFSNAVTITATNSHPQFGLHICPLSWLLSSLGVKLYPVQSNCTLAVDE